MTEHDDTTQPTPFLRPAPPTPPVAALAPLPLWVPTPDNRRFNDAMICFAMAEGV